ncbi:MAG TPA: hypothetical protein VIH85_24545 [Solirubrobacteraceae bacterium]
MNPTAATRARLGVALAASALALLFAMPASALASTGHSFAGQFGAPGNEDGQFASGGPAGIALLPSSGELFAVDPGHTLGDLTTPAPRIERFDASGAYGSSFSIDAASYGSPGALALDPAGSGSLYVAATELASGAGVVLKYSAAGVFDYALDASTSTTTINAGAGIAVDPTDGTVFATATDSSTGAQVIDTFNGTTGAFVSELDGSSSPETAFSCPTALAVGGGDLFVLDPCTNRVDQYSTAGVFGQIVDDGSRGAPVALSADPTTGEPFVGEAGALGLQVTQFSAAGAARGQSFGPPNIAGLSGLAVDHSTGTVYTADNAAGAIERFTTFEGPTVQTTGADSITPSSATLNGTINPQGVSSTYHFEYGLDTSYGSQTAESDPLSGSTDVPATATASGLLAHRTYHYRIVGTNASGSITGQDETFTTAPAPPTLDGQPAFASSIMTSSATLNATLDPNGSETTYHFEFGTEGPCASNPCSSTPDSDAGEGSEDQPVSAALSGLQPDTTYHYRLIAENGTGGVRDGAEGTFSTAPAGAASASPVSVFAAELHATINSHGAPTSYHFEYGTTTEYGASTPETDAGSAEADQLVSQPTARLTPATTYHVRVVATTGGQTITGEDGTFTTGAMPLPVALEPTGVTTTEATLSGTTDTHGLPGSYRFEVSSLSGEYSSTTDLLPTPTGDGPQPVSAHLSGLPPGESFLVVLSVTSNQATASSEQASFATAPLQAPPSRPAIAGGPYGCSAPAIDPYNAHPRPDSTIAISGHDLGVAGNVMLAGTRILPTNWSPSGFSIQIPQGASGTLPLTVNCGHASNTIAVSIFKAPVNAFAIAKASAKGKVATLSLKLPGPGKLATAGKDTVSSSATVAKAGSTKLTVRLSRAGQKALGKAKRHTLKLSVRVTYTPTGGAGASQSRTLTFKARSKR